MDQDVLDDLYFTQRLADNILTTRKSALKSLIKHLDTKSQHTEFSHEDFLKIWKGLFYCMYNADKPIFQEELAENIGHLIHNLATSAQKHLFLKVAFETFAREWNGLDKFRMDKYYMLFARVLRQYLYYLHNINWCIEEVLNMSQILESTIICPFDQINKISLSLKIYLSTILLQELSKVAKGSVPDQALVAILSPFFKVVATSSHYIYIQAIQDHIMEFLIKHSKLGILHQEDVAMNELELADVPENINDDDHGDENELDPHAGGRDVYLPLLNPNYKMLADTLKTITTLPELRQKNKLMLSHRIAQFLMMDKGEYPYGDPLKNLNMNAQGKMKNLKRKALKKNTKIDCKLDLNLSDDNEEEETPVAKRKRRSSHKCKKPMIPKLEVKKKWKAELEMRSKLKEKLSNPEFFLRCGSVKDDPLPTKEVSQALVSLNKSKRKVKNSKVSQLNGRKIISTATKIKKVNKQVLGQKKKHMELHNSLPTKQKALLSSSKDNLLMKANSSILSDCEDVSSPSGLNLGMQKKMNAKKELSQALRKKWRNSNKKLKVKTGVPPQQMADYKDVSSPSGLNLGIMQKKMNAKKELSQALGIKSKNSNKKLEVKTGPPPQQMAILNASGMKSPGKMLKINIGKNKEHAFKDYHKAIRSSPGIPYSASKMPLSPALKPSIPKFGKKSPTPKYGKKPLDAKIKFLKSKYNVQ